MKVKIVTLGCKLNKYESDCMANLLINEGYEITNEDFANIYIINTEKIRFIFIYYHI